MLWAYKGIAERLRILKVSLLTSYQLDTAYFFETWMNGFSTLVFTLSYVALISVIFANVKTLAGYDHNQMLFLAFMTQVNFYCLATWSLDNAKDLVADVNRGNLDFILVRPLPSLFYVTVRRVYLLDLFRDAVAPLIIVGCLINWHALGITTGLALLGVVVFICGQLTLQVVHFLFALPVFWLGESDNIYNIVYSLNSSDVVPYEGLGTGLKWLLVTAAPLFIPTSLAASVMLGKMSPFPVVFVVIIVTITFQCIKYGAWKLALRSYTSASS